MEPSILLSTKAVLGLSADDHSFDEEVVMHINAAFGVLNQLGIGDQGMFTIEDDAATWIDFDIPADQLTMAKQYIFLKVKIVWDPPQTSFHLDAAKNQIQELEHRILIMQETAV